MSVPSFLAEPKQEAVTKVTQPVTRQLTILRRPSFAGSPYLTFTRVPGKFCTSGDETNWYP